MYLTGILLGTGKKLDRNYKDKTMNLVKNWIVIETDY